MVDLSQGTIKDLFYQQIQKMTLKKQETLSIQFGDSWI